MKGGTNVPMGPLTLADFIGLDTVLSIAEVLHKGLGDSKYRPSPFLRQYVEAGWLGKKSGRGFYKYSGGHMDFVKLELDGPIAVITIDRPKALNALNRQVLTEFSDAVGQVAANKTTRALIVTGGGEKAFVAGADIAEMAGLSQAESTAFAELGHRVLDSLEHLPIPVIAAVNGFALGGGTELALACDFIYASEKAKFGQPEVVLGVIPGFGGTQRLTRIVGRARAKEIIFTGDMIDAQKAKEIGLALEVLPPAELMAHGKKVALNIAKRGPLAVAQAKRVIDAGADLLLKDGNSIEREGFAKLFGSADQKEGMAAFIAKRPPEFRGS